MRNLRLKKRRKKNPEGNTTDYFCTILLLQSAISFCLFMVIYLFSETAVVSSFLSELTEIKDTYNSEYIEETAESVFNQIATNAGGGEGNSTTIYNSPYILTTLLTTPLDGWISSEFGTRIHPVTGNESIHNGLDIVAAEGSAVVAALQGEVIEVSFNDIDGNYITIKHGVNIETKYCHLSETLVLVGDSVLRNQVIGEVGSTGLTTGAHLHFEILIDGINVDPAYYLGSDEV